MAIKFGAWYITKSNAIFSDALESIVNLITGSFALYSIWLASKPSDLDHPYGHGKVEFISSGIEGVLVLMAGLGILFQAGSHFINPQTIYKLDLGILLVGITTIVNFGMGVFLIRLGNKTHSPTLEANGRHLRSDAFSSLALLTGLFLIMFTGKIWLDNLVALIFGFYIVWEGYKILRKSVGGIMDETDFKVIAQLMDILNKNREYNWIDIHNLRVIKYGSVLHIDCHVTQPWYFTVREAHAEIDKIENLVNNHIGRRMEIFIHVDPCIDCSCRICLLKDCPVRKNPFHERITWDLQLLMTNRKHQLGE